MTNPKYDPNNYLKHLAIPVITDNHKINQLFGSYLLRIKWWYDKASPLPQADLTGTLRVHTDTPFGALEPRDYQLKISSHKQIYVQFLTLPIPEFEYRIEVIHPVGLTRSRLEIWEYIQPQTRYMPSNNPSTPVTIALDPSSIGDITAGVTAGFTANIQGFADATASAIDRSDDVNQSTSKYLKIQPWSGDINQHLVIEENLARLEMTLRHTGHDTSGSSVNEAQVHLAIGNDITDKNDIQFDDYLAYWDGVGGTWISTKAQAVQRVYAWTPAGTPDIVLLQLSESIHN